MNNINLSIMSGGNYNLTANLLERFLEKPSKDFTIEDIINYFEGNGIEMINFRYVAEDGKLKALNFMINSREHLEQVLSCGERVDGSSLFSFIEAGSSDLYIVPRLRTAFHNPFSEIPAIDILCSFYNNEGLPLESSPEYILRKAHKSFKDLTGMTFNALGELEYYVVSQKNTEFPAVDQKGYHGASPFIKWNDFRNHAMRLIAECGGKIKYGHSEVGNFSTENESYEQHEIEFLPINVEEAADQLVTARWILRELAYQYGITLSFAPKITVGKAGSGMHIHMQAEKEGKNMMIENGKLSKTARTMIAGMLDLADSLTAFGNSVPTSYLRLVPHQEAPTNICWGDRNRSVLIRVPLGWQGAENMFCDANPCDKKREGAGASKQTVELRSPDGTAEIYTLLAGILVAVRHGFEMPDAIEIANKLYVDVNIFHDKNKDRLKSLEQLPASCWESADRLQEKRQYFEKDGIFPAGTIDSIVKTLKSYDDYQLSEKLYGNNEEIRKLVEKYLHYR